MKLSTLLPKVCIAAFFAAHVSLRLPAQTVVSGVTYKLDDQGGYTPLPRVGVIAVREGIGPASAHRIETDSAGAFQLQIPEGVPFVVLFYGDQRVPELQQLSGNHTHNIVHVTLYTPEEYIQSHPGGLTLDEKYRCLQMEMPQKSEAAQILKNYLGKLPRR